MEHGAGSLAHEHDEAAEVDGDAHRGEPHDDIPKERKEEKSSKKITEIMRKLWDYETTPPEVLRFTQAAQSLSNEGLIVYSDTIKTDKIRLFMIPKPLIY